MNFHRNIALWCLMFITTRSLTEAGECVQRQLGACKVLELQNAIYLAYGLIHLEDFHSPQPEGFALKTSIEINLSDNKHSFENNLPVERNRPIGYNLDNAALVTIRIEMNRGFFEIHLGRKYYRLAELYYYNHSTIEKKYNRYTPILPTFPYNLHLEVTTIVLSRKSLSKSLIEKDLQDNELGVPLQEVIVFNETPFKSRLSTVLKQEELIALLIYFFQLTNDRSSFDCNDVSDGTFSIYADGNIEPFFKYQLTESVNVRYIAVSVPANQTDLIAFVDCSEKDRPNCGSHRVDRLYDCRELLVLQYGSIKNLEGFQRTYEKDVIFNEFIVVDSQYSSSVEFRSDMYTVRIEFKANSILATLNNKGGFIKSVRTKQWFEVPTSPYAVRLLLTTGKNNNFLKISNTLDDLILSLSLCGDIGRLETVYFTGPKIYFDCLRPLVFEATKIWKRPRKTEVPSDFEYHEYGYNFTKTLLDTLQYVSKPLYQYAFGNTTQDWCEGEPKPKVLVESKYDDHSLHAAVEKSNEALRSELQKINAQNNATADIIAAALIELKKIYVQTGAIADSNTANADTNSAVLTELKKISSSSVDINKGIADTKEILLSELRSLKASLATDLHQNNSTVDSM